jgi:hypothetical protein
LPETAVETYTAHSEDHTPLPRAVQLNKVYQPHREDHAQFTRHLAADKRCSLAVTTTVPKLLRIIRYIPAPREWKAEWRRSLLDRAYAKDIAAAKVAKDKNKVESLEGDHRVEIQMHEEEADLELTRYLTRQARRLHVPLPRYKNDDGSESEHWYEGSLTYYRMLTTEGVAKLRDEIRREKKARHESKAVWIPWLSAITGVIGAASGLIALLISSGRL